MVNRMLVPEVGDPNRRLTTLPPVPQTVREPVRYLPPIESSPKPARAVLAEALLEQSSTRPPRATRKVLLSLIAHSLAIAVVLAVPFIFTEAIDLSQFHKTMLVAPPAPPPPPPPPAAAARTVPVRPRSILTVAGKLIAPMRVPQKIAMLNEQDLPPDAGSFGAPGGVPGGVPGGQIGGVLGGVLTGVSTNPVAPPPPAAPKGPIRVGGDVKLPRLISRVEPRYPLLARQAKVQGVVTIDAVIDRTGHVVEMRVISGQPVLIQAALDALSQWRYEPTILNGQAVAVRLEVSISFHLY